MSDSIESAAASYAGGLKRGQFIGVVTLFWVYVTLSNVLYAYGMRAGIARTGNETLFAPWNVRVMQHALLLPCVAASFWASLRVQWRPLWSALPLQLLLGTLFAAVAYPAMLLAELLLGGVAWQAHMVEHAAIPFYREAAFLNFWLASFVSFLPSYGFGLALVTGLALYTRFRNTELRMAALERNWSAARLAALRMQLSPHTLFNLLHTIRGHIEWDPPGAQSMVVQLADLLRRLLSAGERDFAPLGEELQFVRQYLELQQRRFSDRLTLALPAPADLPGAWIPSLILQPLVENAVFHGLAGHQGPVEVRMTARAQGGMLTLRVENTMVARVAAANEGIGIRNVRERLAMQFEGRASLSTECAGGEWVSEISMPMLQKPPSQVGLRSAA